MRTLLMAGLIAASGAALAQNQQQGQAPQQAPQQAAGQQQATPEDPKMKERIRVEGAAGGTAPLPDEKRGAVGAGAGPHRHDHLPSPAKLPRDEPVAPPK